MGLCRAVHSVRPWVFAGLLLFIIPGIILLIRWIAATGFLIGGQRSVTDALSASWEATRGHSWHFFGGALLIAIVGGGMAGVVAGGAAFAAGLEFNFLSSAAGNIASNGFSAVFVAYGVAVYHLIADSTEETSEVFS